MNSKVFVFLLCSSLMWSCTDEMADSFPSTSETNDFVASKTRAANNDEQASEEPIEFKMTDEMLRLKELYERNHSQKRAPVPSYDSYDDTYWSNMYAIRELPATIKVRTIATSGSTANYKSLYCEGKGKEVVLNNSNDLTKNRFFIKVLPASSGIPYLLYSQASKTPLLVGYYNNKPNEKILMAAKEENPSNSMIGWDLLQSSNYKNYYSIQNQDYLGTADPNNSWSIFYYVLEAVSDNKIRYAQRVANKGQQEFQITPDAKFKLVSLEYDVESPSVSRYTFSKTATVKNTSSQEKAINVPFNFYETETSYFNKSSWNVNLNFNNTGIKFPRPTVVSSNVITPDSQANSDALFMGTATQNISRHISYTYPIHCKANSAAKVTLQFVKYSVTAKYTAKAQYTDGTGNLRECVLKGTWSGTLVEDPSEIAPKASIFFTPLDEGGDIILK